jgi:hypothetical protein
LQVLVGISAVLPPSRMHNTDMNFKDVFNDLHGEPPDAGVEHDENGSDRMIWHLGSACDYHQDDKPTGDGKAPEAGGWSGEAPSVWPTTATGSARGIRRVAR